MTLCYKALLSFSTCLHLTGWKLILDKNSVNNQANQYKQKFKWESWTPLAFKNMFVFCVCMCVNFLNWATIIAQYVQNLN